MGPPPRQQQQAQARPAGSACVWVVAAVLLLAVLAGGGCLVFYLTLPLAEAPQWLAAAGFALLALPWAFWILTCAYRCYCSPADGAAGNYVERQPSSSRTAAATAAVAPMPSSKSLKSARAGASSARSGSPTTSSGARRVRFGDTTVLGEEHAAAKDDGGSSVHSNESEAPLAHYMQSS